MKNSALFFILGLFLSSVFLVACNKDKDTTVIDDDNMNGNTELPAIYNHFSEDVNIYIDGDFVVLESTGVPNHGSPYFDASDSQYEAYNGNNANFNLNPNRITEQSYTFRIPLNPIEASNKESTNLGAMGISINGVPFFNQYAAGNSPLTNEINSFDQYNGHPQQTGGYHYHIEPTYLTQTEGKDGFLGLLLDGFPVYGPQEDGATITNGDLDEYHGHFGPTADYPEGIYHYHFTDADPYLNGNGYFGEAGSVTQ